MYRITTKRGNYEYALIDFNLSGMSGSGSVANFNYQFCAKRTLSQPNNDIFLDSIIQPDQFVIQSISSVLLILKPTDTYDLLPGSYFWEFNLQLKTGSVLEYTSPPTSYGDLIILEKLI
jgi:hypothetical protein